ncbi:MAG: TonB-dependent receptor [Burkholderiales bacterium]|nr:TonB-dependent receptor [Burkholderiales bacterium]
MKLKSKLKPICAAMLCLTAAGNVFADGSVDTESISVIGTGQTRQEQSITRQDMQNALPGTSPLKVLSKLPGVQFTSSDPWGSYEWATRFNVRGFNQNQLGFTLDDIPLGDMSYGNNNGLHISRAIASENIRNASIAEGSGNLSKASTNNLGGTVQFVSTDPLDAFGVQVGQTLGSSKTSRTFVRLDSGRFSSGTKAYISFSRNRADKWKGWGPQNQDQVNAKLVQISGENRFTAFLNTSRRNETDYADLSIQSKNLLGWNWDNYAPNWQAAVNAANGIFLPGVAAITNTPAFGQLDAAYYLGRGLRNDELGGLAADLKLTDSTRAKATYYHHHDVGQGHWYTPYVPSSATVPISLRTTEYSISRDGLVTSLTYLYDNNEIEGGIWVERNVHDLTRNYYNVAGPADTAFFLSNPALTQFKQNFVTTTRVFHLQDTISLMDGNLKLNAGLKSPRVNIDATSLIGTRAGGQLQAKENFLPSLGLNFKFNPYDEMFASISQNMRAFQPGVDGPFSTTQAGFNAIQGTLQPEKSTNMEIGVRSNRENLQVSASIYTVDFKNRLLSIAPGGITGNPSVFANVGKVQTNGFQADALWSITRNFKWFNAFSYNDSKYKDNYVTGGAVVATSGKTVVDAPKMMFSSELSYEQDGYFASIEGKYTDKRYYTYLNDGQVPAYTVFDLTAGYKQKTLGFIEDFRAQLNVTNLLNTKYFGTIGSNGFTASDPAGTFMTLQTGAPQMTFVTVSGRF